MATFADRLKELRKSKGEKLKQIADLLSITERNYRRYEAGDIDPPASKTEILADHYGVSVDYLLGRANHWIDVEGNIRTKVTPDILNLDIDGFRQDKED